MLSSFIKQFFSRKVSTPVEDIHGDFAHVRAQMERYIKNGAATWADLEVALKLSEQAQRYGFRTRVGHLLMTFSRGEGSSYQEIKLNLDEWPVSVTMLHSVSDERGALRLANQLEQIPSESIHQTVEEELVRVSEFYADHVGRVSEQIQELVASGNAKKADIKICVALAEMGKRHGYRSHVNKTKHTLHKGVGADYQQVIFSLGNWPRAWTVTGTRQDGTVFTELHVIEKELPASFICDEIEAKIRS